MEAFSVGESAPLEILAYIFSFLDGVGLARCSEVCTRWNKAANSFNLWERFCRRRYGADQFPMETIVIDDDPKSKYFIFSPWNEDYTFWDTEQLTYQSVAQFFYAHKYPVYEQELRNSRNEELIEFVKSSKEDPKPTNWQFLKEQALLQAISFRFSWNEKLVEELEKTLLGLIVYVGKQKYWAEGNRFGLALMKFRNITRRDIDDWSFLLPAYDTPLPSEKQWKALCGTRYQSEMNWLKGRYLTKTVRMGTYHNNRRTSFNVLKILPPMSVVVKAQTEEEGRIVGEWIEVWDLIDETRWKSQKTIFNTQVDDAVGQYLISRIFNFQTNANELLVYNMFTYERVRAIPGTNHFKSNCKEEPYIVTSDGICTLSLWNVASGDRIGSYDLDMNFKILYFGYPFVVVQYWGEPESIAIVNLGVNFSSRIIKHESDVTFVTMSPDHSKLGVGLDTNKVVIWDTTAARKIITIKINYKMEGNLQFVIDCYKLIVAFENGIEVWDIFNPENSKEPTSVIYLGKSRSLELIGDSLLCYSRVYLNSSSWKLIECSRINLLNKIEVALVEPDGQTTKHKVLPHEVLSFLAKILNCTEFDVTSRGAYAKYDVRVIGCLKFKTKDEVGLAPNPNFKHISTMNSEKKAFYEGFWVSQSRQLSVPYPKAMNYELPLTIVGPVVFFSEQFDPVKGWIPIDLTEEALSLVMNSQDWH